MDEAINNPGCNRSISAMLPATLALSAMLAMPVGAKAADLIADNLTVTDAKAAGQIGEQADGMLGVVHGDPDAGIMGATAEINQLRRENFRQAAARSGLTERQEAERAANQAISQTPAGQYYRTVDGVWRKK